MKSKEKKPKTFKVVKTDIKKLKNVLVDGSTGQ